jgi:hypothetical protein
MYIAMKKKPKNVTKTTSPLRISEVRWPLAKVPSG